jgi:peptide-methionine (S)-S-oxide reductase
LNIKLAPNKVGAEVMAFKKFWLGEAYHQNYERLHPNQGYIRAVSIPRLNSFKAKFPQLLKETH